MRAGMDSMYPPTIIVDVVRLGAGTNTPSTVVDAGPDETCDLRNKPDAQANPSSGLLCESGCIEE